MATFDVCFLGCKVSYHDAQEIRERLLADRHDELRDGDVAVVNSWDDYSRWLVDAPVGALVRVRDAAATKEGILGA